MWSNYVASPSMIQWWTLFLPCLVEEIHKTVIFCWNITLHVHYRWEHSNICTHSISQVKATNMPCTAFCTKKAVHNWVRKCGMHVVVHSLVSPSRFHCEWGKVKVFTIIEGKIFIRFSVNVCVEGNHWMYFYIFQWLCSHWIICRLILIVFYPAVTLTSILCS